MKTKICLVSLFTLLLTFAMYQGWLISTQAAPTGLNTWTSAYANTGYPTTATLTIPAGNNRLLVVAIASTRTTAGAITVGANTPSFGTKPLTVASSDFATATTWNHTAIYYLKEADLAAATNNTLTLSLSGGTAYYNYVYYRVYQNVDQNVAYGTGNGSSRTFNSGATANSIVGPFSPTLTVNADDQAVEIVNLARSATGTTARTIATWAAGWTTANIALTQTTAGPMMSMYIRDRAVPVTLTNDGSQHTANSASTWDSMTALSLKAAPTTTTLTVNGNYSPTATSKLDSDTGVFMQRVTAIGSGTIELANITLDDAGTATNIGTVEVYISPTQQNNLPTDAVLLGSISNWSGASTQIPLTGGTQADRTLSGANLTKYLYIIYDMSPGQATNTVQSHITGVGVVAPNTGATGLNLSSTLITLARSGNLLMISDHAAVATTAKNSGYNVVMERFRVDCDTFADNALELDSLTVEGWGTAPQPPSVDGVKVWISPTRSDTLPADALLMGQVQEWDKASVTIPFLDDFGAVSADRTIVVGTPKYVYLTYDMYYIDSYLPPPDGSSTVQHIGSKITAVAVKSPDSGLTGLTYASNDVPLTKGTFSKITTCGGCHDTANIFDGSGRNAPDGKFVGSHRKHTNQYNKDCTDCHAKPALNRFNHANGFLNLTSNRGSNGIYDVGSNYSKGRAFKISNTPVMGTCSNLYCHSSGASEATGVLAGTTTTPTWGNTLSCSGCHGAPPSYLNNTPKKNTHGTASHQITCDNCHYLTTTNGSTIADVSLHNNHAYNVNPKPGSTSFTYTYAADGGQCSSNACHVDVKWGGSLPCTGCHAQEQTINAPGAGALVGQKRRAVATEFTLTWSHKRSASGVVTKEDCIVCHMEGDKASGGTTSAHKNGIVELRDPDTGLTIKQVTFSTSAGSGSSAGTFSSTAADATFTRFSRDLSVTPESDPNWPVIAGVEINMCLKCHDSNGASNASAQVPGGTALKPFNTTIVGHSAPFDANGVGNVVNVDKSFNTTNASYHPVKGRGNNSYIKNAMMKGPYTLATNKVGTNTTSYGILITCWDCHAPTNATGVQTATVTAHGGAVTLRRNIRTAASATAPSLCTVCHAESYRSTSANHGTASAFNVGDGNMNATSMANCHYCHSSYNTVYGGGALSVRPLRGDDVHGFNDRTPGSVGSKWPSGSRPYAFWRTGLLSNWAPKFAKETLTVTATCGSAGKSPCSNSGMSGSANIVGVGGSY